LSIYTSAFSFYSDRKLWAWQYSLSIYELKYTSKQRNGAVICFSVRIDRLESYFPSAISSYYQDQLTTSLVHVDILNIVDIGMRFTILSCPNLWAFFVRISYFLLQLPSGTILIRPSMIKIKSDPELCGVQTVNSLEIVTTRYTKKLWVVLLGC
jgi:hypothetical protein